MFHLLLVYIYLIFGIYNIIRGKSYRELKTYLIILAFITFKLITNYRTCSIAYLECKFRRIKRKDSYMNKLLDPIVDLRYTDHVYFILPIVYSILGYYFIYMKDYPRINI